jgi:hypothetical protein
VGDNAAYAGKVLPLSLILAHCLKVVSLLTPLALLSGACFPLVTRMMGPGRDARGALAGSCIAGFVIAPRTDMIQSFYVLSLLYALAALAAVVAWANRGLTSSMALLGGLSLVLVGYSAYAVREKTFVTEFIEGRVPGWDLLFYKPGLKGSPVSSPRRVRRRAASSWSTTGA